MIDRVKEGSAHRRSENKKYRYMIKIYDVDDVKTRRRKEIYMRKQEEVNQEVGMALHNEMVMKKICEGENKCGLYDHMKMIIEKRKEQRYGKV